MNIYQKVNEVRKAVKYIQKDTRVNNYSAVTHDLVTAKTREAMIEQGIIIEIKLTEQAVSEVITKSGSKQVRYEGVFAIDFINMEEPKERIQYVLPSHAIDVGDKATGKAISYAVKNAMLKVFNLETGENEESRVEGESVISSKEVDEIKELMVEVGADEVAFMKFVRSNMKVKRLEELNSNGYNFVISALETKRAKK